MLTRGQEPGKLIEPRGRLSLVVALVLLTAAACSSVSLCLESEKGVWPASGSPRARTPAAKGARRIDRRGDTKRSRRGAMRHMHDYKGGGLD